MAIALIVGSLLLLALLGLAALYFSGRDAVVKPDMDCGFDD